MNKWRYMMTAVSITNQMKLGTIRIYIHSGYLKSEHCVKYVVATILF